jgi:hypothetical protein
VDFLLINADNSLVRNELFLPNRFIASDCLPVEGKSQKTDGKFWKFQVVLGF